MFLLRARGIRRSRGRRKLQLLPRRVSVSGHAHGRGHTRRGRRLGASPLQPQRIPYPLHGDVRLAPQARQGDGGRDGRRRLPRRPRRRHRLFRRHRLLCHHLRAPGSHRSCGIPPDAPLLLQRGRARHPEGRIRPRGHRAPVPRKIREAKPIPRRSRTALRARQFEHPPVPSVGTP